MGLVAEGYTWGECPSEFFLTCHPFYPIRSGYQRPGFTRAQTVPAEVWPERTDNSRIPREFAHRTAVLAHAVSMFV